MRANGTCVHAHMQTNICAPAHAHFHSYVCINALIYSYPQHVCRRGPGRPFVSDSLEGVYDISRLRAHVSEWIITIMAHVSEWIITIMAHASEWIITIMAHEYELMRAT